MSVHRQAGSSSGFRKPGRAEQRVLVQKHRAQSLTKVAINWEIPGHQYVQFKKSRVLTQPE